MAPKRKADIPTLDELLEKPWCYYCEKECSDLNSLQDHQKAMHLRCTVSVPNGMYRCYSPIHKLSYYEPHYRVYLSTSSQLILDAHPSVDHD